jgi:hypothetical protein
MRLGPLEPVVGAATGAGAGAEPGAFAFDEMPYLCSSSDRRAFAESSSLSLFFCLTSSACFLSSSFWLFLRQGKLIAAMKLFAVRRRFANLSTSFRLVMKSFGRMTGAKRSGTTQNHRFSLSFFFLAPAESQLDSRIISLFLGRGCITTMLGLAYLNTLLSMMKLSLSLSYSSWLAKRSFWTRVQ